MAILTSAFAYLGSYYGEANPSLQGTFKILVRGRFYQYILRPKSFYKGRCYISGSDG